jgi:hypothetical protein
MYPAEKFGSLALAADLFIKFGLPGVVCHGP